MWFWKKKKSRMIVEYDAMEEAKKQMKAFEEKYHILSVDLYNKTCDMNVFEDDDKYFWESYIRNFIKCGGSFEKDVKFADDFDDNFECSILKEELDIKKNIDIKKETANMPFFFSAKYVKLIRFAENFVNPEFAIK